jgi:hypothetical protein
LNSIFLLLEAIVIATPLLGVSSSLRIGPLKVGTVIVADSISLRIGLYLVLAHVGRALPKDFFDFVIYSLVMV